MAREKSCGAVVFTRTGGEVRYVLAENLAGEYGFPKGHMEPGESEEETALREICEEVGLRPALLEGFRTRSEYPLPNKPGVVKEVVFFLAEYEGQPLKHQPEELRSARLATYEEAMSLFIHESNRRILREAQAFLNQ